MTSPHPDFDEQLALPHFEDRLLDALRARHPAGGGGATPAAPARRRGARPGRAVRRTLVAASVLGVAAAALVVVANGRGPAADRDRVAVTGGPASAPDGEGMGPGDATTATTGSPEDALRERIVAANENPETRALVHVVQENVSGHNDDTWTDEATGAFRTLQHNRDGSPSFDSGPASPPAVDGGGPAGGRERVVDHCFRQYTEGPPALAFPAGPTSATSWVAGQLEDGSLVLDGTEVVEGRELIRLRETYDGEDMGNVLIDPETYRPVVNVGYPGSDAEYVQRFEYLPRTAENLARMEVPVPEGFTRVDQLRGDGERLDAGCG